MDPNALWRDICRMLGTKDYLVNQDDANELCQAIVDLQTWLEADGFLPKDMEHAGRDALFAILAGLEWVSDFVA